MPIMLRLASATDDWFLALVFCVLTLLALEYRTLVTMQFYTNADRLSFRLIQSIHNLPLSLKVAGIAQFQFLSHLAEVGAPFTPCVSLTFPCPSPKLLTPNCDCQIISWGWSVT